MKTSNLREMTEDDLQQAAGDIRKQIFDINVKKGAGDTAENPLQVRGLRKDLARIQTVINERQRDERGKEQPAEA